jgi:putative transposase
VPWREMSAVDAREAFIREYLDGIDTMTELCERHGISRQTGYTWVARYDTDGIVGLQDRSRRPHHSPTATPPAVVEALIAARRRRPTWGPKKLLGRDWHLAAQPAHSTASAILKRAGLVAKSRRRVRPGHPGAPPAAVAEPNAVWTLDFKGHFRIGGQWCYPLTVIDRCTRYVLACHALRSTETGATQRVLTRVFQQYGLPERIRSDNGVPFATAWAVARLSPLAVWWIRLGIVPELITPGCPQQNGRHERYHRTLKAETADPPAATWAAQQQRFLRYRQTFNHERPHEALGQRAPAEFYVASPRAYPTMLPALIYPADCDVRHVGASGSISWAAGRRVFVSHVLVHEDVAMRPLADGLWAVYFGPLLLGHLDDRQKPADHITPVERRRDQLGLRSRQARPDTPVKGG